MWDFFLFGCILLAFIQFSTFLKAIFHFGLCDKFEIIRIGITVHGGSIVLGNSLTKIRDSRGDKMEPGGSTRVTSLEVVRPPFTSSFIILRLCMKPSVSAVSSIAKSFQFVSCRLVPYRKFLRDKGTRSLVDYFVHNPCRIISYQGVLKRDFSESQLIFLEIFHKGVQVIQNELFKD